MKKILLTCNFCGKDENEVKKLIAGPDVMICDSCIDLCNDIMDNEYYQKKYVCPYCNEKTDKEIFEPDPKDW